MTIHNFILLAGGALWLYILFCLSAAIHHHAFEHRRLCRRKALIRRLFSCEVSRPERQKAYWKLQKAAKSELLVQELCNGYLETASSLPPTEQVFVKTLLLSLLQRQMDLVKKDPACTCLLLSNLSRCSLTPEEFHSFAVQCRGNSILEQYWIAADTEAAASEPVR